MNTKKYLSVTSFILVAASLLFSCKKDKAMSAPTPYGMFGLHIHSTVHGTELDSGDVGVDVDGRKIKLNVAQFYFSNIVLKKADGSEVRMNNMGLKTIGGETYVLGEVPAGNYIGFSFQVGLDSGTNKTLPSSYASSNVLAAQDPAMWFGSSSQGYMFMNVEGYVDTSAAMNGNADQPFSLQLGTGSMLKTIVMPAKSYSIVANQPYYIHMNADYGVLLHGLDLRSQNMASPFNNASIAVQAAGNVPDMFAYE